MKTMQWSADSRAMAADAAVRATAANAVAWQRERAKARARKMGREFSRDFNTLGQAFGKAGQ